ncbi:terminase [Clavibacter capsici]|uniref:terminase n=1 Tax=Clavibacter capsici TaxID=1874630 RepID=UPI0014286491|nr:terminase [Clavibacter capsici]QIS38631.1 terminase [Clavibacter capsici]
MSDLGYLVDFPTLGDLADAWLLQHGRVPDGFRRGAPFRQSDWQFWCTANHYRVRPGAVFVDPAEATDDNPVLLNQAFEYRRSQVIAPQKTGKGPWSAGVVAFEAVGPSVFGGWAGPDDAYKCDDHGCLCGWEYPYIEGEAMGIRHPSPLIQLTATSEDQVMNVYRPLTAMIKAGPLADLMLIREGFIRIVGASGDDDMDRIDVVTSSARSRLGNPISFALQDESGLGTKQNKMTDVYEAQRRGAAGMGGRTMETTNCWDPSQNSTAQKTYESPSKDIFKFYREPPKHLSYRNKRERHEIHKYVYEGSPWVNLASIEGEAAELLQSDPAQAERFFGNRLVQGQGAWIEPALWESAYRDFDDSKPYVREDPAPF